MNFLMNAFMIESSISETPLKLMYCPRVDTQLVNRIRAAGFLAHLQREDFEEEDLSKGIYILNENTERSLNILRDLCPEIMNIELNSKSWILKFFLRDKILAKLKQIDSIRVIDAYGNLEIIIINEKLSLNSTIFYAYPRLTMRIEKFYGNFYLIIDYGITIKSENLRKILSRISSTDVFLGLPVKCIIKSANNYREVVNGIIIQVNKDKSSITVDGFTRKYYGNKLIQSRHEERTLDIDKCHLLNNPIFYNRLLKKLSEDLKVIIMSIRKYSLIDVDEPQKERLNKIQEYCKKFVTDWKVFPIIIGGVEYNLSLEPLRIDEYTYW